MRQYLPSPVHAPPLKLHPLEVIKGQATPFLTVSHSNIFLPPKIKIEAAGFLTKKKLFVNTLYAFFISLYKGIQNNYLSAPARRQAGLPAGRRGQAGIQSQRRRQKHEIKEHFLFFSFSFLCNG